MSEHTFQAYFLPPWFYLQIAVGIFNTSGAVDSYSTFYLFGHLYIENTYLTFTVFCPCRYLLFFSFLFAYKLIPLVSGCPFWCTNKIVSFCSCFVGFVLGNVYSFLIYLHNLFIKCWHRVHSVNHRSSLQQIFIRNCRKISVTWIVARCMLVGAFTCCLL